MPYKDKHKVSENVKKWRIENREKYLETTRVWREKNKERINKCHKIYRAKDPKRYREYALKWYYSNKQKVNVYKESHKKQYNEYNREWAHRNREYLALNRSLYRAKMRKLGADLTRSQWDAIKKAYNYHCAYCGIKVKRLEKEHVIPIARGGATTASNIVPACFKCNRRKSTNDPSKIPPIRLLL